MSESYVHGRCIEWCMFNWEDVYGISYICQAALEMAQGLCFCTAVVAGQEIEHSSRHVFLVAVAFSVWAHL